MLGSFYKKIILTSTVVFMKQKKYIWTTTKFVLHTRPQPPPGFQHVCVLGPPSVRVRMGTIRPMVIRLYPDSILYLYAYNPICRRAYIAWSSVVFQGKKKKHTTKKTVDTTIPTKSSCAHARGRRRRRCRGRARTFWERRFFTETHTATYNNICI